MDWCQMNQRNIATMNRKLQAKQWQGNTKLSRVGVDVVQITVSLGELEAGLTAQSAAAASIGQDRLPAPQNLTPAPEAPGPRRPLEVLVFQHLRTSRRRLRLPGPEDRSKFWCVLSAHAHWGRSTVKTGQHRRCDKSAGHGVGTTASRSARKSSLSITPRQRFSKSRRRCGRPAACRHAQGRISI